MRPEKSPEYNKRYWEQTPFEYMRFALKGHAQVTSLADKPIDQGIILDTNLAIYPNLDNPDKPVVSYKCLSLEIFTREILSLTIPPGIRTAMQLNEKDFDEQRLIGEEKRLDSLGYPSVVLGQGFQRGGGNRGFYLFYPFEMDIDTALDRCKDGAFTLREERVAA